MTNIGEMVSVAVSSDDKAKCPFCGKDLHDFPKGKKADHKTTVESKPKQLNASAPFPGAGSGAWTTAAHHIICAKQCYALLKPLVRMASMEGYDVNDPPNGIALPTVNNPYDGQRWGTSSDHGTKKNYGKLDAAQKKKVAFWAMKETGAQWHVGHHSFEQQIDWDIEEALRENGMPHAASYDSQVIEDLYEIWEAYENSEEPFCEEPEDSESSINADLNQLSSDIRTAIEKFKIGKPRESFPYFVSQRAVEFASSNPG